MTRSTGNPNLVALDEAAALVGVDDATLRALADAGYLAAVDDGPRGLLFHLGDLKAFVARNADNGSGNIVVGEPSGVDPSDLLAALSARTGEMARRALDIFLTVFPEADTWTEWERRRFVAQAESRFDAILAVASQGAEVDEALVGDLQDVGAAAASSGSPLPQLLVVLRISRDIIVQAAIEASEERSRHWSVALALLLTRVLPAMDRLTDSIAQGYWAAVVNRDAEQRARYQHVVEHASDGVYEVDLHGRVQYANRSLALIVGRPMDDLLGARVADVVAAAGRAEVLDLLTTEPPGGSRRIELVVSRPDGVRRVLEVRTTARRRDGHLVGFQGVVRDVTAARDLEADKNEFMALMTYDLRQPLTTILGLGATFESQAGELSLDRIGRMGAAVRRHAERISRLADDLYDISRLEAQSLLLNPRPVALAPAVTAALSAVTGGSQVAVDVPGDLDVLADARRLEQVVANLVENALVHGAPPVAIRAAPSADGTSVEIAVVDHGGGVPPSLVPSLFNRLRLLARRDRDRSRGTGLGLSLVQGLVEAMGGRAWYEPVPGGGADFRVILPRPRRV